MTNYAPPVSLYDGHGNAILPGRAAAAASLPITLSTEDLAALQGGAAATTVASGELAGSTGGAQCPSVAAKMVRFKAQYANAGRVYVGGSGVTVADGSTDATTGLELSAGDDTGWLPADNLSRFYYRSNNAGDALTYLVLA